MQCSSTSIIAAWFRVEASRFSDSGVRVLFSGFRFSFRVWGFGFEFRNPGFGDAAWFSHSFYWLGAETLGFRFRVSGSSFGIRVSGFGIRVRAWFPQR